MKKPALSCKAFVSAGLYADWLASEYPHYWQRQADGRDAAVGVGGRVRRPERNGWRRLGNHPDL